jgi:SAM-dependent methyltransferase
MATPLVPMLEQDVPAGDTRGRQDALCALLADLYARQRAVLADSPYLGVHGRPACVRDQVRIFDWYAPYLPPAGTVLDWGCNHAPDSCLLRARFGDRYQLHGCDFKDPDRFGVFHGYAGLSYTQLTDPLELPYQSGSCDAVIGAGVLEHVAVEPAALRQLYRVLKPGGILVIYYLPNRWSVQEAYRRLFRKPGAHLRLYGLGEIRARLKRYGFLPLDSGHHFLFWTRPLKLFLPDAWAEALSCRLSRWLPLGVFGDTLRVVAQKRWSM